MILYPAIAACLREEGLAADITGPRPHGFGVRIAHNGTRYEFSISHETASLFCMHPAIAMVGEFDLADPDVWRKIKEAIERDSKGIAAP